MKNLLDSTSISRDYLKFSIFAIIITFSLCGWIAWSMHDHEQMKRNYRYRLEADRLANGLNSIFDNISYLSSHLALKISESGKVNDIEQIHKMLKSSETKTASKSHLFSSTYFDWIDTDGKLIIDTRQGVFKEPIDVSNKKYVTKAKNLPWKTHIAIGFEDGRESDNILPVSYGITDEDKRYVGAISMEFPLEKIANILEETLTGGDLSFVILDKQYNILIQSYANQPYIEDLKFFAEKLKPLIEKADVDTGYLKTPIEFGKVRFSYFRSNYKYPFTVLIGENSAVANNQYKRILYPRVVEAVTLIAFILLLLYFFRKRVITPMMELARFAEEISIGNFKAKLPKVENSEAMKMARALIFVKRFVYKEHRLKNELEEANKKLSYMDQVKSRFVRHVIHDVRSPLISIHSMAEIIYKEALGHIKNQKYVEYANDIMKVADHISDVVNDLLDLDRLESGQISLKEEVVDVKSVISQAINILNKQAGAKNIEIKVNYKIEDGVKLISERKELLRIFINLLSNSIKYSRNDKDIVINLEANKNKYEIEIIDNGFGIDNVEEALKPYNSLYESYEDGNIRNSAGLGLSIVKKIMESVHNGGFVVKSEPNEGTKFLLKFPKQRIFADAEIQNNTTEKTSIAN